MSYFVWGPYGWLECDYGMHDGTLPRLKIKGKSYKHPDPQHWHWVCKQVKERDEWRCTACNRGWFEDGVTLDCHHRTYLHWGNELLGDVYTLCRACHETFHIHREVRKEVRSLENAIQWSPWHPRSQTEICIFSNFQFIGTYPLGSFSLEKTSERFYGVQVDCMELHEPDRKPWTIGATQKLSWRPFIPNRPVFVALFTPDDRISFSDGDSLPWCKIYPQSKCDSFFEAEDTILKNWLGKENPPKSIKWSLMQEFDPFVHAA